MDLQKIAQEAVKAAAQAGTVNFSFNDIHHNQNVFVGADGKVGESKNEDPEAVDYGRLPLFVTDRVKLATLVRDLSVCRDTADVARAVAKLSDGRIPAGYKQKTFAAALLPMLKFETTESAIYQALNNFS